MRLQGETVPVPDMLLPHRRDYLPAVFCAAHQLPALGGPAPYVHQDNTVYFTNPTQILVNEVLTPAWGTYLGFTREFLALHPSVALWELPLIQNPHQGHQLRLSTAQATFVSQVLADLEAEYYCPDP